MLFANVHGHPDDLSQRQHLIEDVVGWLRVSRQVFIALGDWNEKQEEAIMARASVNGGTYPLGSYTGSSTRGRRIDCGIYAGELSSGYAGCFSGEALRTTISLATSSSD